MSGPRARILVVEDSEDDIFFLKRAFRKAGVNVLDRVLSDGQSALDFFAGRGPYADRSVYPLPTHMLLDLKVPKVNGLEILDWIRRHETLSALPAVVLSSSGERDDRDRAVQLGIDGYFIKPSRGEQLLDIVRQIDAIWKLSGI
ncbi:MAG TPA: response regulator [Planctomycetota bacterium]|nr:response regulator [Planctomycetota bacterium]